MNFSIDDIKIPLGELYDSVVTDHSSRPRNFVRAPHPRPHNFAALPDATVTTSGDNPTCGDDISLSLKIDPVEDRITGVGFTGRGCTVCMASTSIMTTKIKGKTRAEASMLLNDFQGMITGQTPAAAVPKTLGDLRLLSGVAGFPQRIKCATLGWHALRGALADSGGKFSLDNDDGAKF